MEISQIIWDYMLKHEQSPAAFSPTAATHVRRAPERRLMDIAYMVVTVVSPDGIGYLMHLPLKGAVQKVGQQRLDADFITEEHSHDHIELAYVAKGSLHQSIGGEELHFKEGEFCLIDSSVPHHERLVSDGSVIAYLIFDDTFFSNTITQHSQAHLNTSLKAMIDQSRKRYRYIRFTPKDEKETASVSTFTHIVTELLSNYPNKEHIVANYIERLLVLIPREYKMNLNGFDRNEQTQALVDDIYGYISENISEITVRDVAEAYHYHPDYLNRLFRQHTGRTLSSQIQRMRMEQALTLLLETKLPVQTISNQVGYNNVSYFYQKFRELFDRTPDEMRKETKALARE